MWAGDRPPEAEKPRNVACMGAILILRSRRLLCISGKASSPSGNGPIPVPGDDSMIDNSPRALRRFRPSRRPGRDVHRPRLSQARRLHRAGLRGLPRQGRPAGGFLAWPIILAELVGGLAILAGFYGRLVLGRAAAGAARRALFVHAPNGWVFNAPNGGWEYPAFLAVAALAHVLIGDGAFAVKPIAGQVSPSAALLPRAA